MDASSKSVTVATARPPRSNHPVPTYQELRRDGFVLYWISWGHEVVYMLPDRSTWYCRLLHTGRRGRPSEWEILNRNDMDD